ncbi:MAG: hypothetical protein IKL68_03910 [Clostridia bacterium]|nr:hypothetical protein [Clostridia bacterium]
MNENVNNSCICTIGYEKGAFKKAIENNIFTIFGNISKNNSVVLRYHGELIDNICYEQYENNLYIKYFFNDDKNTIHKTKLAKCTKCIGENYCVLLDLKHYDKITFSFCVEQDIEKEDMMSFTLNIKEDLLSSFMERYEDVANSNLPAIETKHELNIKNILQTLKEYFLAIKRKITSI